MAKRNPTKKSAQAGRASGIGADGRPIKLPNQEPSPSGTKVCPSQDGATNWYSPSYNPSTGLYYVQTNEKCSIYTRKDQGNWEAGKTYLGGSQRTAGALQIRGLPTTIVFREGKPAARPSGAMPFPMLASLLDRAQSTG